MPTVPFRIIDPLALVDDELTLFLDYFDRCHKKGQHIFYKEVTYTSSDERIGAFRLSSDIIWRERTKIVASGRWEVIGQCISSGGYGVVYQVNRTLRMPGERSRRSISRVIKVQPHDRHHPAFYAEQESRLLRKANHLSAKIPTLVSTDRDKMQSYLVMRQVDGQTLEECLELDRSGKHILTLVERFDLAKALLYALKNQVSDKGIIHRDIKPDNIKIKDGTVVILDFGIAVESMENSSRALGTPNYIAPESLDIYFFRQTEKTDVFSLGRVLGLLFGDNLKWYSFNTVKANQYASVVDFGELFSTFKIKDKQRLKGASRPMIGLILTLMCEKSPDNRLSIDEAISAFSLFLISSENNSDVILPPIHQQLQPIWRQLQSLWSKSQSLRARGHEALADELSTGLALIIKRTLNFDGRDWVSYRRDCAFQVNQLLPKVRKHRDNNYIYANIFIGLCSLFSAFLYNKIKHHQWFFYQKTDTQTKLEGLQQTLVSFKI